jgi:hypothetical protein
MVRCVSLTLILITHTLTRLAQHGATHSRTQVGPANPKKQPGTMAMKNMWNGFVEAGDVSDFNFEDQRRTYVEHCVVCHAEGTRCSIGRCDSHTWAALFALVSLWPADHDVNGHAPRWTPSCHELENSLLLPFVRLAVVTLV